MRKTDEGFCCSFNTVENSSVYISGVLNFISDYCQGPKNILDNTSLDTELNLKVEQSQNLDISLIVRPQSQTTGVAGQVLSFSSVFVTV